MKTMKKLIIGAAVVLAAVATQAAATFNWVSDNATYGLNAAGVLGNGSYDAGTTKMSKTATPVTFVLALYDQVSGDLVGKTPSADVKWSTTGNKFNVKSITIDSIAGDGTTYDYVITITGSQKALTDRGIDGAYDYTNAKIETTLKGSITTGSGAQTLTSGEPVTWTVTGIVASSEPTPEPTSALLMLLGVAGLALRRRRA